MSPSLPRRYASGCVRRRGRSSISTAGLRRCGQSSTTLSTSVWSTRWCPTFRGWRSSRGCRSGCGERFRWRSHGSSATSRRSSAAPSAGSTTRCHTPRQAAMSASDCRAWLRSDVASGWKMKARRRARKSASGCSAVPAALKRRGRAPARASGCISCARWRSVMAALRESITPPAGSDSGSNCRLPPMWLRQQAA